MHVKKRLSRPEWLTPTVLAVGVASFLNDFTHEAVTSILPAFMAGLSDSQAAPVVLALFSASESIANLARLAIAPLSDMWGFRKPFILVGYAITGFCTSLISTVTSCWHVLIMRTLAWFGKGVREAPRDALLGSLPSKEYGHIFGFERAMDTLGGVLGPLYMIILWPILPTRALIAFMGVYTILLLALVYYKINDIPTYKPEKTPSIRDLHRGIPRTIYMFMGIIALFGASVFHRSLLILYAQQALTAYGLFGARPAFMVAAFLYTILNIFRASAEYGLGVTSDTIQSRLRLLCLAGFAPHIIASALLVQCQPCSLVTLSIIFICEGISLGALMPLAKAHLADSIAEHNRATGFAALAVSKGLGDVTSGIIVAWLWSYCGATCAFTYTTTLALIASVFLIVHSYYQHNRRKLFKKSLKYNYNCYKLTIL